MKFKKRHIGVATLLIFSIIAILVFQKADYNSTQSDPVVSPVSDQGQAESKGKKSGSKTDKVVSENSDEGNKLSSDQSSKSVNPDRKQVSKSAAKKSAEKLVVIDNKEYPLRVYKTLLAPNDPGASQWWTSNTKLNQMWDIPKGQEETLLAIIDTGFALKHEEFQNRWHINSGESGNANNEAASSLNCSDKGLPLNASCNLIDDNADKMIDNEVGSTIYQNPSRLNCSDQAKALKKDCNRIDDDGNGYIDDITGWDFANYDNSVQAGELNGSGDGTTHGTMVAGVAAATGNNNKGIAGVDWNTKILPIQALDDDSYGDTRGVGRSILYAAEQGADVISISLGSDLPDDYVREAIEKATALGSVVVAAAGNDGCDCMVYPANYPEVVGVGALNSSNQRASFSSWGENLDIMAPGTQLNSPTWTTGNVTAAYASGVNGTSFATPMVSGVLTRLVSHQPDASPLQLIAALTENTNRLNIPIHTSKNPQLGYGTLDAFKASNRMITPQNLQQLNTLSPISRGGYLHPNSPREVAATFRAHECAAGTVGSTSIYELTKGNEHFFSMSKVESWEAQKAGYTSSVFADVCLQQPHDRPENVRALNIMSEFRDKFIKP